MLLNIVYEHLRGGAQHGADCKPGQVNPECDLCGFHQRLAAPVLESEIAEERRIRAMVDAINSARVPG